MFSLSAFLPRCLRATTTLLAVAVVARAADPEPHAEAALRDILATRAALVAADPVAAEKTVFVAFWDFDGTVLRGDCSEGLEENGAPVYPGLARVCIEQGLSRQYPKSPDAFARFWDDYQTLDRRVGHWLAYPYLPQMLHGASADAVRRVAADHFQNAMAAHYFASSLHLLRGLEAGGVRNYVISASADVFVDASAATLGLPVDRLHGIEQRHDAEGRLTTDLIAPITFGEGKLQKLLQIVAALHATEPARRVVIVAAFGNSYSTDGPFLEYVARQPLPGGHQPVVLMIDGGTAPTRYQGLFREVHQRATLSGK